MHLHPAISTLFFEARDFALLLACFSEPAGVGDFVFALGLDAIFQQVLVVRRNVPSSKSSNLRSPVLFLAAKFVDRVLFVK